MHGLTQGYFCKFDQIHRKLRILPGLFKKAIMENIFCAVIILKFSRHVKKY